MKYQICHAVLPEIPFLVVPGYRDMELCLLERIRQSGASQVLVTGKMQPHVHPDRLQNSLGREWTVFRCGEPTREAVEALLESFAEAINKQPGSSQICLCPAGSADLQSHFLSHIRTPVALAVYMLGLTGALPSKDLLKFKESAALLPAPATLECLISADDPDLLIRTQAAIRTALSSQLPVDDLLAEAIELLEHLELCRLGIEEPVRSPGTGSQGAFRPRQSTQSRKEFLESFEHLRLSYTCTCGKSCTISSRAVDPSRGAEAQCPHCGAVVFVPPSIFDETRRVRPDWSSLIVHRR